MAKRKQVKRKQVRRVRRVPRAPRGKPGHLLVTKTFFGGNMGGDAMTGQGYGNFSFSLTQNNDLLALIGLFDQYRINAVKITCIPGSDTFVASNASLPASALAGLVFTYQDHTDANTPANIQEVLDRSDYKMHTANAKWSEYISKPKVLTTAEGSGQIISKGGTWIGASTPDTKHYGWKWVTQRMYGNQTVAVYIKLYVEFKDPR